MGILSKTKGIINRTSDRKEMVQRKSILQKVLLNVVLLVLFLIVQPGIYAQQPNVVLFIADDLGWADLSCYGNRFNESPHIDGLAKDGILFTSAYAGAPVCSPSRASLQSGQYPVRTGIIDFMLGHWRPFEEVVVPKNRQQYLPLETVTIAETLKKSGYKTGYFGKWHLGEGSEFHPLQQGYDEAYVGSGFYNVKYVPTRTGLEDKVSADQLAYFGDEFIDKHKSEPFFLIISYSDVHVPYDAEQELIDKYLDKPRVDGYPCHAVYAAMIEQMDKSIGRVLKKLEKENLLDNTLVVFTSDNGGSVSENPYPGITEGKFPIIHTTKRDTYPVDSPLQYMGTSNLPLRNEKGTVFEGGIRVPLIVCWGGNMSKGTQCDVPVIGIDLYPTIADVIGAALPRNQILDGVSIKPLFRGQGVERPYIFWYYPVYHHDVPSAAVRSGEWKLIRNLVDNTETLYNLKYDIGECTDLSKVYTDKLKELSEALTQWQREVRACVPVANKDFNADKRHVWGIHPDSVKH